MAANYGRIRPIWWRFTVDPQLVKLAEFSSPRSRSLRKSGKMDISLARRRVSLLLAVIKNPRVTFYRCSTVVSLLVSRELDFGLVAFRNGSSSGLGERERGFEV